LEAKKIKATKAQFGKLKSKGINETNNKRKPKIYKQQKAENKRLAQTNGT